MTQYTPGPWRIGSLASYDGYTGKPFRNVWAGGNDGLDPDSNDTICVARCIDNDNCDHDASLIAAAPDLLAACQMYLKGDFNLRVLEAAMRDAVCKAQGSNAST